MKCHRLQYNGGRKSRSNFSDVPYRAEATDDSSRMFRETAVPVFLHRCNRRFRFNTFSFRLQMERQRLQIDLEGTSRLFIHLLHDQYSI